MSTVLLSSAYLAPIEYYQQLINKTVFIESHENYLKQTYMNRCHIATANGVEALSIPVEHSKTVITDTIISTHHNWQQQHWRAIQSAYQSSPFFEYYQDDLIRFYTKKYHWLYDFNAEIQEVILSLLDYELLTFETEMYRPDWGASIQDLRQKISPKNSVQSEFVPKEYYQVFKKKHGFLPNLSILDLLFNMGPESRLYLSNQGK